MHCRCFWISGLNPNDEMEAQILPFDPLRKLIQRKDGIPAREFLALSGAATPAKQLKHENSQKTKDS